MLFRSNLGESHRPSPSDEERQAEHKDIAHPITLECREYIQKKVLEAYEAEKKKGPVASRSQETEDHLD